MFFLCLNINQQQCYRMLQQLVTEDRQKQSQYNKVQCSLKTLYKTMKFVLEINLRCNLIPAKALESRYLFEDLVYDAF